MKKDSDRPTDEDTDKGSSGEDEGRDERDDEDTADDEESDDDDSDDEDDSDDDDSDDEDDSDDDSDDEKESDSDDEDDSDDDSDDDEDDSDDDEDDDDDRRAQPARQQAGESSEKGGSPVALVGLVALVVGAGGGWIAHQSQSSSSKTNSADISPATAGSAGPCKAWEAKVCEGLGDRSPACNQAKGASEILPTSACDAALAEVPATLTKIKAARADCDELVKKLCADLGKESKSCDMVTKRTTNFPAAQCTDMLKNNYDKVLGSLKQMEQRRQQAGGNMPPGHPGGPPPGHPNASRPGGGPGPGGPKAGAGKPNAITPKPITPKPITPKPVAPKPAAPAPATPTQ